MSKVSVVITVHNNQDLIKDCLKSVKFADEIVVIDNESTDKTAQIAKELGAVVYKYKNNPKKLNESKNYGFSKAKHDWILSLDSDEKVEEDLKKEIQFILSKDDIPYAAYEIPRHNIIFGKVIRHGLWYPDYQIRLFQKDAGRFPNVHNHELLKVSGKTGTLKGHIEHLNYQTISQYLQKIDKQYSDNEVDTFLDKKQKITWADAIRFPVQDFLSNYFARQAYKDGLHGLVLSILQAFYMFIVFAKIWERQGFKESQVNLLQARTEGKKAISQFKYWYYHEQQLQSNGLSKILYKLKAKL